jgi:hypothetical protein
MAKWKEGWKVIYAENRTSIVSRRMVKYPKNRVAKRPKNCGPLTLFDTEKHAREAFSYQLTNREWALCVRCEYLPSRCKTIWHQLGRSSIKLPRGTILAEQIRCLE